MFEYVVMGGLSSMGIRHGSAEDATDRHVDDDRQRSHLSVDSGTGCDTPAEIHAPSEDERSPAAAKAAPTTAEDTVPGQLSLDERTSSAPSFADKNGVPVNGALANGTDAAPSTTTPSSSAPLPNNGAVRTMSPTRLAQEKYPNLPVADQTEFIRIEPQAEEQEAFDYLIRHLPPSFSDNDIDIIMKAYVVASYAHRTQWRQSGEPYMLHPIVVTTILCEMLHMDADTLAAGLLHDVAEDTEFTIEYIHEHFGPEIATMVDGVTKLKRIRDLSNPQKGMADSKAESLRKMFLAMVDDVRVVLIKLADRLHNMRTLGSQPSHKRKRIARETLDIFAPLANRLGIWQVKWELEDMSFRHVQPETYRELSKAMQQKRSEREKLVIRTKHELESALAKSGITAEVSGRPKHIYSIWKKMQKKNVPIGELYDLRAVRVLVDDVPACYAALGVVHALWAPIPSEFDDYIARPKHNDYRSLHTAVVGPEGKTVEVQIRTHEMHAQAELGVAAHWRYKEQSGSKRGSQRSAAGNAALDRKIEWMRRLLETHPESERGGDERDLAGSLDTELVEDRIYALTPAGEVIDLPHGATPLDFAY
ncbi:MAG: bifunctional (p)ppGpp synthetase/guanosine-3',5'-bis(diphosphate) 3'-pyrophosphohydrolase, partial [Caldilineaceae bacterium]|nr:bifunctional (p)ppGpp synthetase/guanosine-3',5'-bis(diphosphate) 3'-pyrophosphohydrolase [Caldilineaceae bacterium]